MERDQPPYKLYPLWSVFPVAAGAGIFSGAFLIAANYRNLGNNDAAWQTAILGLAAAVIELICLIYADLPKSDVLELGVRVLQGVVVQIVAIRLQGDAVKRHVESGGMYVPWWTTVVLALLGIAIFLSTVTICACFWAAWKGH